MKRFISAKKPLEEQLRIAEEYLVDAKAEREANPRAQAEKRGNLVARVQCCERRIKRIKWMIEMEKLKGNQDK